MPVNKRKLSISLPDKKPQQADVTKMQQKITQIRLEEVAGAIPKTSYAAAPDPLINKKIPLRELLRISGISVNVRQSQSSSKLRMDIFPFAEIGQGPICIGKQAEMLVLFFRELGKHFVPERIRC